MIFRTLAVLDRVTNRSLSQFINIAAEGEADTGKRRIPQIFSLSRIKRPKKNSSDENACGVLSETT
ncbi:MAG: hypothetical protein ACUVXA_17935 [Candidatus Jordarchaeum sp.]|uniref:hypothetical protein n=1 Tax=Candidatus Jordarchaeum sp. TaxID=2823881 RepID=UPI00404B93C3